MTAIAPSGPMELLLRLFLIINANCCCSLLMFFKDCSHSNDSHSSFRADGIVVEAVPNY